MSFSTVDMTSLIRGEGEWKNMQEIVRRTLKICFEQMDKQSEQVAHLVGQVASLKSQLANKVNKDEVDGLIKSQSTVQISKQKSYITHAEYDKLKGEFAHMRNDLERKASVRYVDECLRLKYDKSDVLVKNLATFSAAQYSSQLTQLYDDLSHTKSEVGVLTNLTSDIQRDLKSSQDMPIVKSQMEAIYRYDVVHKPCHA